MCVGGGGGGVAEGEGEGDGGLVEDINVPSADK